MTNDTALAELLWFINLSDADRVNAIKNDITLCYLCDLFPYELPDECEDICKTYLEFRLL